MKEWSGGFPNNIPAKGQEGSTLPVSEQGQAGTICYVDDSKTSAYVTRKILKDQKYQVDHFTSAEPAIVALLQKDYDLLITDLTLDTGGMDGDELLRFLRRSGHPRKKSMPVILITGHTDKDTLLRLYESGANAVLTKPIAGDTLMEKVRNLIPEKPEWNPPHGAPEAAAPAPVPAPRQAASTPASQARGHAARKILMQQAAFRKNLSAAAGSADSRPRTPPQAQTPAVRTLRGDGRRRPVPSPQAPPVRPVVRPAAAVEANPFAELKSERGNGSSLGQTLGGAVKSAMEAARQKLAERNGKPAPAPATKPGINEAAALINRLRQQKKAEAEAAAAEAIPTLQERPPRRQVKARIDETVQPDTMAAAPMPEPATPVTEDVAAEVPPAAVETRSAGGDVATPPPEVNGEATESTASAASDSTAKQQPAGNFGIEAEADVDVDLDNLFSGLVPDAAAQQAAAEAEVEAQPEARRPQQRARAQVDDDERRMITALDVGTDLVNAQDSFYEDSRYSLGRPDLSRLFSGPIFTALWQGILEYKIIIAAIILAAILILGNFSNVLTGSKTVEVETVRVGLGSIHQSLTVPGKVVSNMKVEVSSSSPGKIVSMKVKEGAMVSKGAVLAEIENEQAVSDVKRAEGNLQSTKEETALAEKTWKRMRHAFGLGAVSRFAVEEAEAALKTAKARQAVALEELRSSRLALNKLSVNAPFDGTITVRHAQLGQWVSPSEPLFTLVDLSKREVEVMVDTADSGMIRPGQAVSLSSDAHGGKRWMESVIRIGTATNRSNMTNTVSVFVSLGSGAPDLRIGQQIDAEVRTSSSSNIIKLPIEALITRNGSTWVAVVQDGRVHFSPVVIGMEDFTHVEVLEGVQPRQEVIIPRDASSLQEGDLVRVLATRTVE